MQRQGRRWKKAGRELFQKAVYTAEQWGRMGRFGRGIGSGIWYQVSPIDTHEAHKLTHTRAFRTDVVTQSLNLTNVYKHMLMCVEMFTGAYT
jgi:hypothetical protein